MGMLCSFKFMGNVFPINLKGPLGKNTIKGGG